MNRKIVATLLSTFVLSSAGDARAESPATLNAISIGGGVHAMGSAGPVLQEDWQVIGTPASNSKFAKLRAGMSYVKVETLIGLPDKVTSHQTGKAWIPFYYGKDAFRIDLLQRGRDADVFRKRLREHERQVDLRDRRYSGTSCSLTTLRIQQPDPLR